MTSTWPRHRITGRAGFPLLRPRRHSVQPGELEAHVNAYKTLGFTEIHREDVLGGDQVREVLLQVGDGPTWCSCWSR